VAIPKWKLPRAPPSSQHEGVSWDRVNGKWKARITVGGKQFAVGSFADEAEAAAAYTEAQDTVARTGSLPTRAVARPVRRQKGDVEEKRRRIAMLAVD
jgi:hypothetical protein